VTCKYKVKIKYIQYNYKVQMTDIQSKYKFKVFCTGYDDSEIKEKIDVMYQAWPKVSGEGETITLNDTANTTMTIDLKGNTSQETTTGKNLFDNVYGQTGNVYTKNINAVSPLGSIDCYPINLSPNTQYTLKIDMNGYQKTGAWVAGVCFENGNVISLLQLNSMSDITTTTFTTDSTGVVYVGQRYGFTYGTTGRMDLFLQTAKIQLEKGSTATDFEPYTNGASPNPDYPQTISNVTGTSTITIANSDSSQSQNYTINLGDIELCKIGTYQDYIYKENGKWYLEKKINKVVLDGSENWYKLNLTFRIDTNLFTDILSPELDNMAISDYFIYWKNTGGISTQLPNNNFGLTASKLTLNIRYNDISDVEEFKSWLSTHNTEIYYVLATPTTEEITDSTLISQLEEIKKAESYSGQTNISQTNDDKPFILTAKALKDLSSL